MGIPRHWFDRFLCSKSCALTAFELLLIVGCVPVDARAQGGTISAQNCGTNFNLASLSPDKRVPLMFDAKSGAAQGIYANTVKNKTIAVSSDCFVDPVGAGIFMATPAKPLLLSPCRLLLRRTNKTPSLIEMPLSCSAKGVWYDATVIDSANVLDVKGKTGMWALAKPKSGALKSIEIASKSMKGNKTFATANDGSIANGRISLSDLGGEMEVLFIAKLGSAMPYLIVSPDQLRKLASLLAPADSADLLQKMAQ